MAEQQLSQLGQRLAAFAAAVSTAMTGAREVAQAHEEQQRRAESRARRRDRARPRMMVYKPTSDLVLARVPSRDFRNLVGPAGRVSLGPWQVWRLDSEPWSAALTSSFVGSFDTWDEAMLVASQYADRGHVHSTVDDDAGDYVSWGEVPC